MLGDTPPQSPIQANPPNPLALRKPTEGVSSSGELPKLETTIELSSNPSTGLATLRNFVNDSSASAVRAKQIEHDLNSWLFILARHRPETDANDQEHVDRIAANLSRALKKLPSHRIPETVRALSDTLVQEDQRISPQWKDDVAVQLAGALTTPTVVSAVPPREQLQTAIAIAQHQTWKTAEEQRKAVSLTIGWCENKMRPYLGPLRATLPQGSTSPSDLLTVLDMLRAQPNLPDSYRSAIASLIDGSETLAQFETNPSIQRIVSDSSLDIDKSVEILLADPHGSAWLLQHAPADHLKAMANHVLRSPSEDMLLFAQRALNAAKES